MAACVFLPRSKSTLCPGRVPGEGLLRGGDTARSPSCLHLIPTPPERADPNADFPASGVYLHGKDPLGSDSTSSFHSFSLESPQSAFLAACPFRGGCLVQKEEELSGQVYDSYQPPGLLALTCKDFTVSELGLSKMTFQS